MSGGRCWTDIENHDYKVCSSCNGDYECAYDLEWSDHSDIGNTVCNFFDSLRVDNSDGYIYLEVGGVEVRSAGSSLTATCAICMCEGIGMSGLGIIAVSLLTLKFDRICQPGYFIN